VDAVDQADVRAEELPADASLTRPAHVLLLCDTTNSAMRS